MVNYFSTFFTTSSTNWERVIRCTKRSITSDMNTALLAPVELDEVKSALFHMHPDKSPALTILTHASSKNIGILLERMSSD